MKKLCFIFSCLLATASHSLSAQSNFTPVNVGSVNVGSSVTTSISLPFGNGYYYGVSVIGFGGAFSEAQTSTCGVNRQQNPCTVDVVFSPTHGKTQYGILRVTDAYGNNVVSQLLEGTGLAPESSFSPGFEFGLAGVPSPTGISVGISGIVYVPTSGYGRGGSAVQASLFEISPKGPSTYNAANFLSSLYAPSVWTDQVGNAFFYDQRFLPNSFSKNFDTRMNLSVPVQLAGDLAGNLFVVKPGGTTVYKESPVTISYLSQGIQSYNETTFATGSNVWTDWFGNVFVLNNGQLDKYILQPDGSYVQTVVLQSLSSNLTVDGYGNIYGGVDGGDTLYKETLQPNGAYVLSPEIPIGNPNPENLTADNAGNLFYSTLIQDLSPLGPRYKSIMKEDFSQAPSLTFASTALGSASTDSPRVVTITNHGNLPLQFSSVTYPTDFPEASGVSGECAAGTSLLSEESCTITITFSPITPLGANNAPVGRSGAVKIVTNTLNASSTEQDITVNGTATIGPASTPVFSIPAGTYNNMQTVTITDATPGVKIYYTLNGTSPTTASNKYTGPVAIRNSFTLNAIAIAPGTNPSAVASAYYNLTASTPVVSLPGGTYATAQTITITTDSPSAKLFYTLNGGMPSANSTMYKGPITITAPQTLRVIAIATGYTNSPVVVAAYNVQAPPVPPTFSVPAGTYDNTQYVTITEATTGATIYYTLNGTTPTTASMKYTGPVAIRNSYTLTAIATATGYTPSSPTSAAYSLAVATPVVSLPGGSYTGSQTVNITCDSTSAHLYYTTNGTTPTTRSLAYSGPIPVSASTTLKVIAVATGYASSSVVVNSYTIQ